MLEFIRKLTEQLHFAAGGGAVLDYGKKKSKLVSPSPWVLPAVEEPLLLHCDCHTTLEFLDCVFLGDSETNIF
ncbi:hypothetical protein EI555_011003 [Monodon monoceros]|uniref:Uncharacterized protein n=1 Tax=Monodon monoceros TaxID=40151 RepID=A0A4U1FI41_MONMO|nr:hypothetical protein EI555_011003 [Monodon monoceros]